MGQVPEVRRREEGVMPYGGNPATDPLDQLRLWIGDTDPADPLLSDSEVQFFLSQFGTPLAGAISACRSLIAKFARYCDERVDKVDVKYSQISANLKALLPTLESQMTMNLAEPMWAGGISISDKDSRENDSDRVIPAFTRDMMFNEGGSNGEAWDHP